MFTRNPLFLQSGSLRLATLVIAVLVLCSYGGAAHAADVISAADSPGFWSGFGDGMLSLLRFLASPLTDVTIFDGDAQNRLYDVGYFFGVLTFTGAAGAAALPKDAERTQSGWM